MIVCIAFKKLLESEKSKNKLIIYITKMVYKLEQNLIQNKFCKGRF